MGARGTVGGDFSRGNFGDALGSIGSAIADAFSSNRAPVGPGNPDQRNNDARNNSSGTPAASPDANRGAPVRRATPAPATVPVKGAPPTPTAVVPKPGPAPVKKRSLLTEGGLARPTLGGVSKTLLGS